MVSGSEMDVEISLEAKFLQLLQEPPSPPCELSISVSDVPNLFSILQIPGDSDEASRFYLKIGEHPFGLFQYSCDLVVKSEEPDIDDFVITNNKAIHVNRALEIFRLLQECTPWIDSDGNVF